MIAGASIPIGTHREVWHTGTEGIGVFTSEGIKEQDIQVEDPLGAAKFIVEQVWNCFR